MLSLGIAGQSIAAPVCNIGANPWWKDRPFVKGVETKYRVKSPTMLVRSMSAGNVESGDCKLLEGEVLVIPNGFATDVRHPELEVLPTDSEEKIRWKLSQSPRIFRCNNPITTLFRLTVTNRETSDGIPEAEMTVVNSSGDGNINMAGNGNTVIINGYSSYRPKDDYQPRKKSGWSDYTCDTACKVWVGVGVVALIILATSSGGGNDSPPPQNNPPQGNTGGTGSGGTPPQGNTGGSGSGIPEGTTN